MSKIRPFQIPGDIDIMLKLIEEGFQYPDRPDWNVQDDEKESMLDSIKSIRRIWPMIQFLKIFVPYLRDIMRGFIYEEDGIPVGLINFGRQRNIPEWFIGNVTVLPRYRRRGIARKLVEASLAELIHRRARSAWLEVIAENEPANRLYEEMGFTAYSGSSDYDIQLDEPVSPPVFSEGTSLKALKPHNWKIRMEFAQRITPELIQHYEPIRKESFKTSRAILILIPLIQVLSGSKSERFAILRNGKTVSFGEYSYRTKTGGLNNARIQVDPDNPEFASLALDQVLSTVQSKSPGRRLEIHLKNWQPALLHAAEDVGCTKSFTLHKMAKRLDEN